MGLINRTGTYRGVVIEGGPSETPAPNSYPQLQLQLHAVEYYDEDEGMWIDWSECDENEMIAYLMLAGSDTSRPIFHWGQVEKVFDWDGESFSSLAEIEYANTQLQFRIEFGTGDYSNKLQVSRIDLYDAVPGRQLTIIGSDELKQLDARYAKLFRTIKGEKKPVKLAGKPTVPTTETSAENVHTTTTATTVNTATPPKRKSKKTTKKSKGCSQSEAWLAAKAAKAESVSDAKLTEIWIQTVETDTGGEDDDTKIAPEMWAQIRDHVIEQVTDNIPF